MKTKLILDVNKTQYAQLNSIVTGRVGDKTSNIVDVYVIDNGSPYNLTGLKVFFECTKPDNTAIRDDNGVKMIDATKGHFEYTFPVETFGAPGKAKRAFFSIEKDTTTRATTQDFELVSLRNALDGNILSSHYISDFEKITEDAEKVKDLLNDTSQEIKDEMKDLSDKFDKAIEEGGVTPEVIVARDGEKDLKDRLDKMDKKNQDRAIIAFTFDDSFFEDRLTYSIFKEYELACTFAVILDRVLTYNQIDWYRLYQKNGFTIMSHSHSHQDMDKGTQTLQEAEYEIANSALSFAKYGLSTNGWVTPNSVLNEKYYSILRANYDYGVTTHKGFLGDDNIGHVGKNHDPYKLYRYSLTWNSLDKIKAAIDNCVKEKGLLLFYDHRTGAGTGHVDEAKLRAILAYAKSKQGEGELRILNMNDAISSFFGLDLQEKTRGNIVNNISPSLFDTNFTSLQERKWYYSRHLNDVNETFKTFKWKTEELSSIEFPQGAPISKAGSLQTKVPLQHLNMDLIDNQTIYFAQDVWINGDYTKIKVTLEVRFFDKDGNFDGIHVQEISPANKRRRFASLSTIFKRLDFDYAMVYFKYEFTDNIDPGFKIFIGRPVISFGIPVGDFNHTDGGTTYGSDSLRAPIYTGLALGTPWNRKTWVNYKLKENFENSYLKANNSATFEAKWSGFYNIGLNAHFQVSGGGDLAAFCRVVFDIGKTGFSPNGAERVSQYYKTPDDKFSLNVNKTIYLNKGDKIYIRGFFDDNVGELKELRETAALYVTFIK